MKKSRPTLAHDMDSTSKTEDVVVITEMGKLEKQRKQAGRNNLNPAITSDRNRAVLEEKNMENTHLQFHFLLVSSGHSIRVGGAYSRP